MPRCPTCGNAVPQRRRYCSDTCWLRARSIRRKVRPAATRRCRACAAKFKPARRGQIYCCPACRQAEYRARLQGAIIDLATGRGAAALLRHDLRSIFRNSESGTGRAEEPVRKTDLLSRLMDRAGRDNQLRKAGVGLRPPRRNGRSLPTR